MEAAQAAVDAWVVCYNTDRPHQGLDVKVPVVPADRFVAAEPAEGVELWLPATLEVLDTLGTAQAVTELVTGPVTVPAVVVSAAVGDRAGLRDHPGHRAGRGRRSGRAPHDNRAGLR